MEGDERASHCFFLYILMVFLWTPPLEVRLFITSHSSMITVLYGHAYILLYKSECFIVLVTCYTEMENQLIK